MTFNILYKGRKIYQDLSYEQCTEILDELSSKYYTDEEFDIEQLELEEI
mgnify:FL=1|jgi:hypothetical protein